MKPFLSSRFRFGFLLPLLLLSAALLGSGAATPPLTICLLSASAEYQSDKSLAEFQTYLESHYRINCQRAFGKDKTDDLPGLEALETSDLMLVFTRRLNLPEPQLARIKKYIASGRPIIGLRTASHAFQTYLEFDREVLGGGYNGHYGDDPVELHFVSNQAKHPVLAGVTPFSSQKLYKNPTLASDATVLLEGTIPGHREPVAWVREHNGSRVFYTSLGIPEDFAQESFRRLLVNSIFWTTRRDEAATRRPSNSAK
jgi:type 1 glutamine amidotransferase